MLINLYDKNFNLNEFEIDKDKIINSLPAKVLTETPVKWKIDEQDLWNMIILTFSYKYYASKDFYSKDELIINLSINDKGKIVFQTYDTGNIFKKDTKIVEFNIKAEEEFYDVIKEFGNLIRTFNGIILKYFFDKPKKYKKEEERNILDEINELLNNLKEKGKVIINDDLFYLILNNKFYNKYFRQSINSILKNYEDLDYFQIKNNQFLIKVERRNIGNLKSEKGIYIHVVNIDINSLSSFINNFKNITGEICVSDIGDFLFHTKSNFLGILLYGVPNATFSDDVYSRINELTGRRIMGDDTGSKRTEAWMVPSKSKIVGIVTDIKKFQIEAEKIGIKVFSTSSSFRGPISYKDEGESEYENEIENKPLEDNDEYELQEELEKKYSNDLFSKFILSKRINKFNISKRAEEKSYIPTPNVIIEPIDPLVQKAVNKIKQLDSNFFMQVEKIIVHVGGGGGSLGYVKRGPSDNPRVIHIYKDRIKEIIQKQFDNNINVENFEKAVQVALIEVIAHEKTHIGEKPEKLFKGEGEAEQGGRNFVQKVTPQFSNDILLNSSLKLNDIREKYLPNISMAEPSLPFLVYCSNNDKSKMVKEGIRILRDNEINSAILDINNAYEFNNNKLSSILKKLGFIDKIAGINFNSDKFIIKIADFQLNNDLIPNGKLDYKTLNKIAEFVKFDRFPKNFGVVVPGKLYRGAMINDESELIELKEQCGIKRVVSLHNNPRIKKMCSFLDIEYVPAFLEYGNKNELGMKIFGNSVLKFLSEKPTYIHCYCGQDRTGAVIARFRTESGWPCKLAYLEAKSYGFKDIFVDFIDWFCSPSNDKLPINTDNIRKKLKGQKPYINPELINFNDVEQNAMEAVPNDMPFKNPFDEITNHNYITWSDQFNNITPCSLTPPIQSI